MERWGIAVALALGLTLWAFLTLFIPSLMLPVKVVSDGPIYHLYFAARWWKAGRIFLVPTPFGETAAPYFPALGDLWLTWLVVLGGGDRLARVGQVPFLAIAAVAVVSMVIGLFTSSMVSTAERAMPLVFLLVMIQVVTTGGIFAIHGTACL